MPISDIIVLVGIIVAFGTFYDSTRLGADPDEQTNK